MVEGHSIKARSSHTHELDDDVEEEEDDVGPALPPAESDDAPKRKKRRTLKHEAQYVRELPSATQYEQSFMHRDVVTHVAATATDFIVTGSADGVVKFWKKTPGGVEFVKLFHAHPGNPISHLTVSDDGAWLATTSRAEGSCKIFDVVAFDMVNLIRKAGLTPNAAVWVTEPNAAAPILIVADAASPAIHFFNTAGEAQRPPALSIHANPVSLIAYNAAHRTIVSIDTKRLVEYWQPPPAAATLPPTATFTYKSDTDLYTFAKSKVTPLSLAISPTGTFFAALGADAHIRIFHFPSGKLRRVYDESLTRLQALQSAASIPGLAEPRRLEGADFGRRVARERALEAKVVGHGDAGAVAVPNVVFDGSGNFVVYGTAVGVKVVNVVTNRVVRVLGSGESAERFVRLALYQGTPKETVGASVQALKAERADPTLVATSFDKPRFFLFSTREPEDDPEAEVGRDVFNEKPMRLVGEPARRGDAPAAANPALASSVTLHTTFGDIGLTLHGSECPKTVENFVVHCRNGYYNLVLFHRVIKSFMLQTGDPQGDGTGGKSIWGGEFEDEIVPGLKHDRAGTLSMANAGPNSNGSQFFITTVPCPWLDGKHTVFGRVSKGLDVVKAIEGVKCDKKDRPLQEIKIVSVSVQK